MRTYSLLMQAYRKSFKRVQAVVAYVGFSQRFIYLLLLMKLIRAMKEDGIEMDAQCYVLYFSMAVRHRHDREALGNYDLLNHFK